MTDSNIQPVKFISIEDVRCKGCKMNALLDENGRCEFCRRKHTVLVTNEFSWKDDLSWSDLATMIAIGLFIAMLYFFSGKG